MTFFLTNDFFGFGRASPFRAHDIEHALLALLAVFIFMLLDRRRGEVRGAVGYAALWVQYFFGIHALVSGLVYFLRPDHQAVMDNALAGPFQVSLEALGLFAMVKGIEVLVGLCLVFNRFVPLAAIFEMPISVMIFYLSVFIVGDVRTIWTGPKELLCNIIVLLAYWGYFRPIFRPGLAWRPFWDAKEWRARPNMAEKEQ